VLPTRAKGPVEGFLADIDAVDAAARSGGPHQALQTVLTTVGLRAHHSGDDAQAVGRVENLDALLGGARDYPGPDPYTTTALFLENSALVSAADNTNTDKETDDGGSDPGPLHQPVLIMTAHASKGKEFDWVYVCGVEEGLFPLAYGEEEPDDIDEERRLLFVACSRARRRLTLTHCRRRMRYGQVTSARLSSFASSLPSEVVRTATPASNGASAFAPRYGQVEQARPITRSAPRAGRRGIGPRLSASQAVPGARVRHASFGEGVVESLHDGAEPTVVVRFGAGSRSLSLDLAPLELITEQ
jgi:DNA helicase-2/ATP-dependent DNA helicase PcrA